MNSVGKAFRSVKVRAGGLRLVLSSTGEGLQPLTAPLHEAEGLDL